MFAFKKYDEKDPVRKWYAKNKFDIDGEKWNGEYDVQYLEKAMDGCGTYTYCVLCTCTQPTLWLQNILFCHGNFIMLCHVCSVYRHKWEVDYLHYGNTQQRAETRNKERLQDCLRKSTVEIHFPHITVFALVSRPLLVSHPLPLLHTCQLNHHERLKRASTVHVHAHNL